MSWTHPSSILSILSIGALSTAAAYALIPDLLLHRLGVGSRKRQYTPGVALTFDDGPDPVTTPSILDTLDAHNAKAVFFVTGANAIEHPELVREILRRGHQVGLHSYAHRYAWFLSPAKTWREWEVCASVVEGLAGRTIEWIRPPWGTFNLVTWLWMKARGKRAVLWSVEGHDWQGWRGAEGVAERVLAAAREGSIVVLHDGGGDEVARTNTAEALDTICRRVTQELKLPLVPLEFPVWPLWRTAVYVLWERWERLFARLYSVQRIDATNIFRLSKTAYDGPDLYDESGLLLATRGDVVGDLHIESMRLRSGSDDVTNAARFLRQAKESLPGLARFVAADPGFAGVNVFCSLTLINRGVKAGGFTVQTVSVRGLKKGIVLLQRAIRFVYRPGGRARAARRSEGLKLVWISRKRLLEKWLNTDEDARTTDAGPTEATGGAMSCPISAVGEKAQSGK